LAAHRLGDLKVDVHASAAWPSGEAEASGYAAAVWEAVGDTLERRHPRRVYRLRSWSGRWRLSRSSLSRPPDASLVETLARACARVSPLAPGCRPDDDAEMICFADEAERVASWWLARTRGEAPHWAWADLDAVPSLDGALRSLDVATATAATRAIEAVRGSAVRTGLSASASRRSETEAGAVRTPAQDDRGESRPVAPGPAEGGAVDAAPGGEPPESTSAAASASPGRHEPRGAPVPGAPTDADAPRPQHDLAPSAPSRPAAGAGDQVVAAPGAVGAAGAAGAADVGGAVDADCADGAVRTRWGGLVHLLGPMLECRLGEILWEACVDERAVLHHALAALAGADPIVAAFSGTADAQPPTVDGERLTEIRHRLVNELRRAIRRRDLVTGPLWVLTAAEGSAVLSAAGVPWPVAVWPPEESPDLEGVDKPTPPPWLPDGPDAVVVAVVVGVPATLLALRLGCDDIRAGDFIDRWLQRPAWLQDDGEVLEVRFAAEYVDLELRRSGADADPGWVPWMRRTVRLTYEARESD
jgi:hypothetical protein